MKPEAEGARPKPSVCRRLFADDAAPDEGLRDNMFNQITEQINRKLDEACDKYNFDFRSEVPLDGDWTWERITTEGGADTQVAESPTTVPLGGPEGPKGMPAQPPPTSDPQAPPADPLQPPTVPQ